MSKQVMVIGGAGFVGSHLVDACVARDWQVAVYDNFSKGSRARLPDDPRVSVADGDILDSAALEAALEQVAPEIVFHLAAIHYIPECEAHPEHAIRVNIEGTQRVLDACGGRGLRLVFTSTGAIYDPEITEALTEGSRIRTGDVYGITKQSCEDLVRYYVRKGRGEAVIARLFNAVGTRETNRHLIPAVIDQLVHGVRRIELGNLYPKRDYVHVRDIADGLVQLALVPLEEAGEVEVFNVGSGVEYTVEELVRACASVVGEPIEIESVASRRRANDRRNQLADISKLRERTGWSPTRSLREALEEVWAEAAVCTPAPPSLPSR